MLRCWTGSEYLEILTIVIDHSYYFSKYLYDCINHTLKHILSINCIQYAEDETLYCFENCWK